MQRLTVQVGSFEVNATLLVNDGRALLVDPGQEAERLLALAAEHGWEIAAVLLTHAHFDHIGAIPALRRRLPDLPIFVAPADQVMLGHPLNQNPPDYPPMARPASLTAPDLDGETVFPNGLKSRVISTPGHTPGGVSYFFEAENGKPPLLLSGDTLFAGSVGRTDLPGGDMATLMASLEKLKSLPPETEVIPGHGMFTTIGRELEANPFLQ